MTPDQRREHRAKLRRYRVVQQRAIPHDRLDALEWIAFWFPKFTDDGLSWFPDSLAGYDFTWAGRLHDFGYCAQARPPFRYGVLDRMRLDFQLARDVRNAVPNWALADEIASVVLMGVTQLGVWSYNSCTIKRYNGRCRHGLLRDNWATRPERAWTETGAP